MIITRAEAVLHPSYHQFYGVRGDAAWVPDQVTPEGYARRLEAVAGFVYIGTNRYGGGGTVEIEVHDAPIGAADEAWQHVVEVSLDGSGDLVLTDGDGPPGGLEAVLPAGPVRLRANWSGLFADDWDLSPEVAPELVLLQAWAGPVRPPTVHRWYSPWVPAA